MNNKTSESETNSNSNSKDSDDSENKKLYNDQNSNSFNSASLNFDQNDYLVDQLSLSAAHLSDELFLMDDGASEEDDEMNQFDKSERTNSTDEIVAKFNNSFGDSRRNAIAVEEDMNEVIDVVDDYF